MGLSLRTAAWPRSMPPSGSCALGSVCPSGVHPRVSAPLQSLCRHLPSGSQPPGVRPAQRSTSARRGRGAAGIGRAGSAELLLTLAGIRMTSGSSSSGVMNKITKDLNLET